MNVTLFKRCTAFVLLLTYSAACTHTVTGEKAFKTFEECVASNLALAAAGGVGVGVIGANLVKNLTGDRYLANRLGTAAGIGTSVLIGVTAWRKCAAAYSTSEVATPAPAPTAANTTLMAQSSPSLRLSHLSVNVAGTENDAPVPEFDFYYNPSDVTAKDVKARLRHQVEIVRFKADDKDSLMLVNEQGDYLRNASGQPIPLADAMRTPREQLAWITIADEGQRDYVEDIVIQPGQSARYRHRLNIPSRAQLPLPLPVPMRYQVTVEAAGMTAVQQVNFGILRTSERPRRFSNTVNTTGPAAPNTRGVTTTVAAPTPPPAPVASAPVEAPSAVVVRHKVRRSVNLSSDTSPQRKTVGRVSAGLIVTELETANVITNGRSNPWVKVRTEAGLVGWLAKSELTNP